VFSELDAVAPSLERLLPEPRIVGGSLRSSVWAVSPQVRRWAVSPQVRRWALALWAVAAVAEGAAAGATGGPLTGLAAAAGVLAELGTFAVACQTGVLVGARAAPRHRLLADVTPAYVASLRYRPSASTESRPGSAPTTPPTPVGTATAPRCWPGSSTGERQPPPACDQGREPAAGRHPLRRFHPATRTGERPPAATGLAAARALGREDAAALSKPCLRRSLCLPGSYPNPPKCNQGHVLPRPRGDRVRRERDELARTIRLTRRYLLVL